MSPTRASLMQRTASSRKARQFTSGNSPEGKDDGTTSTDGTLSSDPATMSVSSKVKAFNAQSAPSSPENTVTRTSNSSASPKETLTQRRRRVMSQRRASSPLIAQRAAGFSHTTTADTKAFSSPVQKEPSSNAAIGAAKREEAAMRVMNGISPSKSALKDPPPKNATPERILSSESPLKTTPTRSTIEYTMSPASKPPIAPPVHRRPSPLRNPPTDETNNDGGKMDYRKIANKVLSSRSGGETEPRSASVAALRASFTKGSSYSPRVEEEKKACDSPVNLSRQGSAAVNPQDLNSEEERAAFDANPQEESPTPSRSRWHRPIEATERTIQRSDWRSSPTTSQPDEQRSSFPSWMTEKKFPSGVHNGKPSPPSPKSSEKPVERGQFPAWMMEQKFPSKVHNGRPLDSKPRSVEKKPAAESPNTTKAVEQGQFPVWMTEQKFPSKVQNGRPLEGKPKSAERKKSEDRPRSATAGERGQFPVWMTQQKFPSKVQNGRPLKTKPKSPDDISAEQRPESTFPAWMTDQKFPVGVHDGRPSWRRRSLIDEDEPQLGSPLTGRFVYSDSMINGEEPEPEEQENVVDSTRSSLKGVSTEEDLEKHTQQRDCAAVQPTSYPEVKTFVAPDLQQTWSAVAHANSFDGSPVKHSWSPEAQAPAEPMEQIAETEQQPIASPPEVKMFVQPQLDRSWSSKAHQGSPPQQLNESESEDASPTKVPTPPELALKRRLERLFTAKAEGKPAPTYDEDIDDDKEEALSPTAGAFPSEADKSPEPVPPSVTPLKRADADEIITEKETIGIPATSPREEAASETKSLTQMAMDSVFAIDYHKLIAMELKPESALSFDDDDTMSTVSKELPCTPNELPKEFQKITDPQLNQQSEEKDKKEKALEANRPEPLGVVLEGREQRDVAPSPITSSRSPVFQPLTPISASRSPDGDLEASAFTNPRSASPTGTPPVVPGRRSPILQPTVLTPISASRSPRGPRPAVLPPILTSGNPNDPSMAALTPTSSSRRSPTEDLPQSALTPISAARRSPRDIPQTALTPISAARRSPNDDSPVGDPSSAVRSFDFAETSPTNTSRTLVPPKDTMRSARSPEDFKSAPRLEPSVRDENFHPNRSSVSCSPSPETDKYQSEHDVMDNEGLPIEDRYLVQNESPGVLISQERDARPETDPGSDKASSPENDKRATKKKFPFSMTRPVDPNTSTDAQCGSDAGSSVVFGDPATFGLASGDNEGHAPTVSERAKAVEDWKGGQGVAQRISSKESFAIYSPADDSPSRIRAMWSSRNGSNDDSFKQSANSASQRILTEASPNRVRFNEMSSRGEGEKRNQDWAGQTSNVEKYDSALGDWARDDFNDTDDWASKDPGFGDITNGDDSGTDTDWGIRDPDLVAAESDDVDSHAQNGGFAPSPLRSPRKSAKKVSQQKHNPFETLNDGYQAVKLTTPKSSKKAFDQAFDPFSSEGLEDSFDFEGDKSFFSQEASFFSGSSDDDAFQIGKGGGLARTSSSSFGHGTTVLKPPPQKPRRKKHLGVVGTQMDMNHEPVAKYDVYGDEQKGETNEI